MNKLDIDEVKYYCTSWRVDFDCLPLSCQIDNIIEILYYYGITEFFIEDIKDFYKKIMISNPRSNGIRKPSGAQILKAIECKKNIQCTGGEGFKIICADTSIYANEIKSGYDKKRETL